MTSMLQGGSQQPVQNSTTQLPSLADHANSLIQAGFKQPIGSPERQQMMSTGLQLSQAHSQAQPPLDGYIVTDPTSGQDFKFPTAEAAQAAKQWLLQSKQNTSGGGVVNNIKDAALGVDAGFIKGTSGAQQLMNGAANALGIGSPGTQQTLGDEVQAPDNAAGHAGEIAGEAAPYIGVGIATDGAGDIPLASQAGLGAATEGVTGFLGTEGNLGQRTLAGGVAAAGGAAAPYVKAAISPVIQKIAPLLSRPLAGEAGAPVDELLQGIKTVNDFKAAAGQEFANAASSMSESGAKIQLDAKQLQQLSYLADKYDFTVPEGIDNGMTPKQMQELNTTLNDSLIRNKPGVSNLYTDLRTSTTGQLNQFSPGLGDEFDNLYSSFKQQTDGVKALRDVFPTGNKQPLTGSQLTDAIKTIQNQDPAILAHNLDVFKQISGIDLTDPTTAIQAADKVQNPVMRQAAKSLAKYLLGIAGLHEINKFVH